MASGSVEGELPHRPPTYGFDWAVDFTDEAATYSFTVRRERRQDPSAARRRWPRRSLGEHETQPTTNDPRLLGNEVALTLVPEDFADWVGGAVTWTASTSWDRNEVIDTCTTDRVLLREADVLPADRRLPEGFPLPRGATTVTFDEHPVPTWRSYVSGSSRQDVVDSLVKALPDERFRIGRLTESQDRRSPAAVWHTTQIPIERDDFRGEVVVQQLHLQVSGTSEVVISVHRS